MTAPREISCVGNAFIVNVRLARGRVVAAWSTGRMLRDMDFLRGLSAEEAPHFTQRPSCLCNAGHALAAVRALEDLAGVAIPDSARLLRNIVLAMQHISAALAHFYAFHLSDWLNLGRALRADPAETARLAAGESGRDGATPAFHAEALSRLAALGRGDGGATFRVRDWAHPAYAGRPEAHLFVFSHLREAAKMRATLGEALKILRCDGPAHPAFRVGGLAPEAGTAPGSSPDLSPEALARAAALLRSCRVFVEETFLADALFVARLYPAFAEIGRARSFLAWPEFPGGADRGPLVAGGARKGNAPRIDAAAAATCVRVEREPSWSAADADVYRLRFGPEGPHFLWNAEGLEWFGAPGIAGCGPCEVGPLARLALADENPEAHPFLDAALRRAALPPEASGSALGRLVARGAEAALLVRASERWLDELRALMRRGDAPLREPCRLPDEGEGLGLAEIPRGALLHRIRMTAGRIAAHEVLAPSLWNFSPRGGDGSLGPVESALIDTPVADPERPLEILRTVHAFDPCNACYVRVKDRDSGRVLVADAQ